MISSLVISGKMNDESNVGQSMTGCPGKSSSTIVWRRPRKDKSGIGLFLTNFFVTSLYGSPQGSDTTWRHSFLQLFSLLYLITPFSSGSLPCRPCAMSHPRVEPLTTGRVYISYGRPPVGPTRGLDHHMDRSILDLYIS